MMHNNKIRLILVFTLIVATTLSILVVPQGLGEDPNARQEINLTGDGWKLWLDNNASWKNDKLYLPHEVKLDEMPVNEPTGGWNDLYSNKGIDISIPANVEEYFGQGRNSFTYHGVSWFWKTVNIPSSWEGRTVRIKVAHARMRAEIYVNEKLAGYDIVSETPFEFDISEYINYGQNNTIAIRITNPGGRRGWEDYYIVWWGTHAFPAGKDFGGIGGEVTLVATDDTYIGDVFVKNLLPVNANKIEVITDVRNTQTLNIPIDMTVKIYPYEGGSAIFTDTFNATANAYQNNAAGYTTTQIKRTLTVPNAKLWDIDNPNLYYAEVTIAGQGGISDTLKESFGFRTFQVLESNGLNNLYFNGKRIRHRSAIDWGYYAQGGNYATDEMARKSVQVAKDIGHNGINFHRQIGDPLVLKYADELGLYMYQEPGGFHVGQGNNMTNHPFAVEIMKEKITRMVIRDRNSPSLIWYNLANEDNADTNPARMWALEQISNLDGTRMITNSSGDVNPGVGHIKHIRPYETEIRKDFMDHHTVNNTARFSDEVVFTLNNRSDNRVLYWGEAGSYTGPSNWYNVANMQNDLKDGRTLYSLNIYQPLHDKISEYFNDHNISNTGTKKIKSPADVSIQAGRGLMYANGRIGQSTMIHNSQDGYAINGWSSGPQLPDAWDSAMLDEARNLKGPAEDLAYWVRDLQIVVQRAGGRHFDVDRTVAQSPFSVDYYRVLGNEASFNIHLINEGRLPKGTYTLKLRVKDGDGRYTSYSYEKVVEVEGGDIYAQSIINKLNIKMEKDWKGGYITIDARLYDSQDIEVANGGEQIILRNRASYKKDIEEFKGAVYDWPAAKVAIEDAGVEIDEYSSTVKGLDYIAAGKVPEENVLDDMLKDVFDNGTLMLVKFDANWATLLFNKGVLSEPVTKWGGFQSRHWSGNGWGYIDYFIGNQALPSVNTISTNGWEVPMDPVGFYPFKSDYPTNAYGAYFARHDKLKVLIGTISYGKGKILLSPGYRVDENNPFNDMLFYNYISMNLGEGPNDSIIYGDVNNDGLVTTQDLVLLIRYLGGLDIGLFNELSADVNGDGVISNIDTIILRRFLAGYPIELGPQ